MTPPLTSAQAAKPTHPRGVFEADNTFPGLRTFRVYDCTGRLLERREVQTELVDAQTRASLDWTLEHYCPKDAGKHEVTCPGAGRSRLRVIR